MTIGGRASDEEPEPAAETGVADAFAAAVAAEEAKNAQASAERQKRKPVKKPENLTPGYIAAIVAGVVCMGIWAGFIVLAHFSLPLIALAVAGVVGTAARLASPACDPKVGLVAAVVSFVAIVGARSVGWTMLVDTVEEAEIDEGMNYTLNEMYKEHLDVGRKVSMTPDDDGMKQRVLDWVMFENAWPQFREPIDAKWNIETMPEVTPALLSDFKRDVAPALLKLAKLEISRDEYVELHKKTKEAAAEVEEQEHSMAVKLIFGILWGNIGIFEILTLIGGVYVAYNAAAYET